MDDCDTHRKSFGNIIELVNLTKFERDEWTQYIGRKNAYYDLPQSEFANPYTVEEYERETSVRLYELWFYERLYTEPEFYESFCELRDEVLACWCLPESCHGEVICEALVAEGANELDAYVRSRFEQISVNLFGYQEEKSETEAVLESVGVLEGK